MSDLAKKFASGAKGELTHMTAEKAMKERTMFLGSFDADIFTKMVADMDPKRPGKAIFTEDKVHGSESLLKMIDEVLVNAFDQWVRSVDFTPEQGGKVTEIRVGIDTETGEIMVQNNGKGIALQYYDNIGQWSIHSIAGRAFTGSNYNDKENPDRVTGGLNGVGLKAVTMNSTKMELITFDFERKALGKVTFLDKPSDIDHDMIRDAEVKVTELATHLKANPGLAKDPKYKGGYTIVKFIPNFANVCRSSSTAPGDPTVGNVRESNSWPTTERLKSLERWLLYRLCEICVFCRTVKYRYEKLVDKPDRRLEYNWNVDFYFNGKPLNMTGITDFAYSTLKSEVDQPRIMELTFESTDNKIRFPWYAAIAINPSKSLQGTMMVNSISLERSGYDNVLRRIIVNALKKNPKFADLKDTMITRAVLLVSCKFHPLPEFSGQTKKELPMTVAASRKAGEIYVTNDEQIRTIDNLLSKVINVLMMQLNLKEDRKKGSIRVPKHEPARLWKTTGNVPAWLLHAEGNSANLMCREMRDLCAIRDQLGLFPGTGVPVNALKNITRETITGEEIILMQEKLRKSIVLNSLAQIMNLDKACTYDPDTPKGKGEIKALWYRYLVTANDQDPDGIGQICSLLLVWFVVFWPKFIAGGGLKRLNTPLIRIKVKGKPVLSFYSERDYEAYIIETYGSMNDIPDEVVKNTPYYKGLSGHVNADVKDIADNFMENIYTFSLIDKEIWPVTDALYGVGKRIKDLDPGLTFTYVSVEAIYGKATDARKVMLREAKIPEYTDEERSTRVISVGRHMQIEAKAFQREVIERKLCSAIDSMIPTQRRVLYTMRNQKNYNTLVKVNNLTGEVTKLTFYPHGDMSMNDTIIKMAQNNFSIWGSNNIPKLVGWGQFGSRIEGRGVAGSARYISVTYNHHIMNVLMPLDDDKFLKYTPIEGNVRHPDQYVPIIPLAVLETLTTPAVGWKAGIWARNLKWTIDIVKQMIGSDHFGTLHKLIPDLSTGYGEAWISPTMKMVKYATVGKANSEKGADVDKHHEMCKGSYIISKDRTAIKITELPLKMWVFSWASEFGYGPQAKLLTAKVAKDEKVKQGKKNKKTGEVETYDLIIDKDPNAIEEEEDKKPETEEALKEREFRQSLVADITFHGCTKNTVEILIRLKPDALEKIDERYSKKTTSNLDAIELFLGIYTYFTPELNLLDSTGFIKEYKTYVEIITDWYYVRKQIYLMRMRYTKMRAEMMILYHDNVLKYLALEGKEDGKSKVRDNTKVYIYDLEDADADKILDAAGILRINAVYMKKPDPRSTEEEYRKEVLHGAKSDYKYIYSLPRSSSMKRGLKLLIDKREKLVDKLERCVGKSWRDLWLEELKAFQVAYEEGVRTHWLYDKFEEATYARPKVVRRKK